MANTCRSWWSPAPQRPRSALDVSCGLGLALMHPGPDLDLAPIYAGVVGIAWLGFVQFVPLERRPTFISG